MTKNEMINNLVLEYVGNKNYQTDEQIASAIIRERNALNRVKKNLIKLAYSVFVNEEMHINDIMYILRH